MNPTAYLIAVILWLGTTAGAFFYGQSTGADREIATQAAVEKAIAATRQAALEGAADAIVKIKIRNTTIRGRVETITRDKPVYRDCVHAPDGLLLINEALVGAGPVGDGGVPGVNAVK